MLTPEYLSHISEGAESIAEDLHAYLIRQIIDRMIIRIGRGDDYLLTSSDAWRIRTLQEAGYLLEDITAELAKYTKRQEAEIREAMTEAGVKAIEADNAIYEAAGLTPTPLMQSPALMRLMERNYTKTLNTWKNYTGTFANASQKIFIDECDKAYNLVTSGAESYTQAVRMAVENVASDGVYVQYPSGRKLTIEAATSMCVRTGVAQACGDITLARMKEMGVKLCIVSSHMGARTGSGGPDHTNHSYWQAGIYAIDWSKINI